MYFLKNSQGIIIPIEKNVVTIGRHTKNDIVVNSIRASRFHSEIILNNNKIFLKDNSTVNGTYIHKHRILPNREIQLKLGDIIGIGSKANEEKICSYEIVERRPINKNEKDNNKENSLESDEQSREISSNEVHVIVKPNDIPIYSNKSSSTNLQHFGVSSSNYVEPNAENIHHIEINDISAESELKISKKVNSHEILNCSADKLNSSQVCSSVNTGQTNSKSKLDISLSSPLQNSNNVLDDNTNTHSSHDTNSNKIHNKQTTTSVNVPVKSAITKQSEVITISDSEESTSSLTSSNYENNSINVFQNSTNKITKKIHNLEELDSIVKDSETLNNAENEDRMDECAKNITHSTYSSSKINANIQDNLNHKEITTVIRRKTKSKRKSKNQQNRTVSRTTLKSKSLSPNKTSEQNVTLSNSVIQKKLNCDINSNKELSQRLKEDHTNVNLMSSNSKQIIQTTHELHSEHCLNDYNEIIRSEHSVSLIKASNTDYKNFNESAIESDKNLIQEILVDDTPHLHVAKDVSNKNIPSNHSYENIANVLNLESEDNLNLFDTKYKLPVTNQCHESKKFSPCKDEPKIILEKEIIESTQLEKSNENKIKSEPNISCVNLLLSDEEEDIKPKINLNYSNTNEIVTLDSDEEDFPLSQLNTTNINDIPDFTSTFEMIYDNPADVIKEEEQELLHCNESTWFDESLSQTNLVEGKCILKMNSTSLQEISADEDGIDGNEDEQLNKNDAFEEKKTNNLLYDKVHQEYSIKNCVVKCPLIDQEHYFKSQKRKSSEDSMITKKNKVLYIEDMAFQKYIEKTKKEKFKSSKRSPSKRKINNTNFRNKNVKKNYSETISQIQHSKLIKLKRKEKLKEIVPKLIREISPKSKIIPKHDTKPIVKNTNKNRGSYLMESLVNDGRIRKKKELERKHSTNLKSNQKLNKQNQSNAGLHNIQMTDDGNKEINKNSEKDDKKCTNLIDLKETSTNIDANIPKKIGDLESDAIEQLNTDAVSKVTNGDPNDENRNFSFDDFLKKQEEIDQKKFAKKKNLKTPSSDQLEKIKISDKKEVFVQKSNLKVRNTFFENIEIQSKFKKRVKFCDFNDCKFIISDQNERRNNGIFAPAFKLNEHLIRESEMEFETAIVKVCSWNVRWLEEQQKHDEPPPLYPESENNCNLNLVGRYKQHLKSLIFQYLWRAIFNTWNKPDNNFLPHTQLIERDNLCYLQIEKIDTVSSDKQLWTIYGSRILNFYESGDDISNGQIVILNFHVQRKIDRVPIKTMVFAYIASINKASLTDGNIIQRIVFKVHAKPFSIMTGDAKMKTLNYLRTYLRPFQALAMVMRSPLTNIIIDQEKTFSIPLAFNYTDDHFIDKYLDLSQKTAIVNCMNSIYFKQPSVYLIDGAPGTGKTQVIVSLIHEIFSTNRRFFPDDFKILIIASSDNTADDLSYRLEALNKKEKCMNLLRYGNCKGMHALMKDCTLDKKIQHLIKTDDGKNLINLEDEINNLRAKIHSIQLVLESKSAKPQKLVEAQLKLVASEKELQDMISENSKVIEQLKSNAAKELTVESADVIITSVNTCWSSYFENDFVPTAYNKGDTHKFTVCIFDDAHRINETGMLIPLMLMVRTLILVGDYRNHISVPVENSPFCRLVNEFNVKRLSAITQLSFQYRMHPAIMEWVNERYNLNCHLKIVPKIKSNIIPFLVINLILSNENDLILRYEEQADACISLLETIDGYYENRRKIAVIVAHVAQRDKIKLMMCNKNLNHKILVDTLEEFSGRERDMVLLFLPYNCSNYDEWLYVAVTRAKDSLIICGDFSHIEQRESIQSLIFSSKYRNLYLSWNSISESFPIKLLLMS